MQNIFKLEDGRIKINVKNQETIVFSTGIDQQTDLILVLLIAMKNKNEEINFNKNGSKEINLNITYSSTMTTDCSIYQPDVDFNNFKVENLKYLF